MARGLVVEADSIGQDAQGNTVQAVVAEATQTQAVAYTTSARTALPFKNETRVINIATDGTDAFIRFGDDTVAVVDINKTPADFDHFQPANTIVSYVRRSLKTTHVALYDGTS